eukprot:TRINITY_DN81020_c0_g1_i1.p1 TRINITY_DN81020_c0_g1~~TRINITY_DN81020_c0_g1_i1.p1  ORF type:complete len:312 (+),score=48.27 TRINITY_DN81020_c0_g1_i1:210-1145(+)
MQTEAQLPLDMGQHGSDSDSDDSLMDEIAGDLEALQLPSERRPSLSAAIQLGFNQCGRTWLCSLALLLIGLVVVLFWTESIYDTYQKAQCDQPLAMALRVLFVVITVFAFQREIIRHLLCYRYRDDPEEPGRVWAFKMLTLAVALMWPFAAASMLRKTRTCNRDLQEAVLVVVLAYVAFFFVVFVLPAGYVSALLFLMRLGYIRVPRSENAAPDDLIDSLAKVEFDPALFDGDARGGYPQECLICLDAFDANRAITRTPCTAGRSNGHVFHTQCLAGWLQCARTCPLCRSDLTEISPPAFPDPTIGGPNTS